MKNLLLISALAMLSACATSHQHVESTVTDPKTGLVTHNETDSVNRSFWDSRNSVDKVRASNGKTQSIGLAGVGEESTGTNVVEGLKYLDSIVSKFAK
jgi:uncharacterized lipoprotein YajG